MLRQFHLEQQIQLAIEILRNGGIVAFPTDTVYGLGASPWDEGAVDRIYRVKKRPRKLPLPLLLADKSDLVKVASIVPEAAWRLAEHFFPGGLTLVLRKGVWVTDAVTAGGGTVAVRVPNHPVPLALIRGLGTPLIGTSANLSGNPGPSVAEEVCQQLGQVVDLIIDGGRCPGGVESTVVDVSGEAPVITREGAIPRHEIEVVCGISVPVL